MNEDQDKVVRERKNKGMKEEKITIWSGSKEEGKQIKKKTKTEKEQESSLLNSILVFLSFSYVRFKINNPNFGRNSDSGIPDRE